MSDKSKNENVNDAAAEAELEGVPEEMREDGEDDAEQGEDDLLQRIADLENQLAEAKQETLYAHAEAQNVRRRLEKDAQDARAYAATPFARDSAYISFTPIDMNPPSRS